MGANIRKRKQLRRKSKNKGKLKFKCHATKKSWKKGTNVEKNLKAIGIAFNPNNINIERKKRYNKLRDLYKHKTKKNDDTSNNDKSNNDNDNDNYDYNYNPRDYDKFLNADNYKQGDKPFLLNIPNSTLKNQLNLSINTKPEPLFQGLPRYKREYYQRLINRYGKDYDAMCNDIKLNFFQWTKNRIKRDIQHYRYEFRFDKIKKQITF